jgi:glycosyltransferase involved in cell wall biosynthesis
MERVITCNRVLLQKKHLLVGITRVRNEALILQDTLDYVGTFVDAIVAYDDASTDETRDILKNHPKVAMVIENSAWEGGHQARLEAETRHRGLLLDITRAKLRCEWIYCFDADERIIGNVRNYISNISAADCNGVRVQLFDAYMTLDDHTPYKHGMDLLGFRHFFGPERRDILMLWRNLSSVQYRGLDAREPTGVDCVLTNFYCQHYGKAISVEQWESTCDYYADHFPPESYGQKWLNRKGRAIHTLSDFSRPLFEWGQSLFANAMAMTDSSPETSAHEAPRSTGRLSLLLATNQLFGWSGSETLLLSLIEGLRENGCEIVVYARHLDKTWACRYIDPRIQLVDSLETIRELKFDLAHVQHSPCLLDIRAQFPTLPIVFSSLGVLPFLEQPVPFDVGVSRYLAISEEVLENLVAHGLLKNNIDIVRNLVSSRIFFPTSSIRPRPERILVLSNKIDKTKKALLRAAARKIDASIRFVGGAATLPQEPLAVAINEADVVVSLGRGAVEAMLCGRVPIVFDIHGGDGMITPDSLNALRTCNFSGRYHRNEYTVDDLMAELGKYRQEYGSQLRKMALEQFGLEQNMARLLNIYAGIAATPATIVSPALQQQVLLFFASLAREDTLLCKRHRELSWELSKNLQNEILRIKHTVSWRITAPLRVSWNLLRKIVAIKLR